MAKMNWSRAGKEVKPQLTLFDGSLSNLANRAATTIAARTIVISVSMAANDGVRLSPTNTRGKGS
jgi:hypothetical protein